MADLIFPNTFVRQYSGPLDKDLAFSTTAARNDYLTNTRRYPGQIVYDAETKKVYVLNSTASAWEDIFGSNLVVTGELTATSGTFTSYISSPALSGTFFGDGSNLTGVIKDVSPYAPLSGANFNGDITGPSATFSVYLSSPSIYGSFYGDGSNITGIDMSEYAPLSGANFNGSIYGTYATFNESISAPALYGKFYGDGTSLTLLTGIYAPLSGATFTGNITGTNATFTESVSAPLIYGDGSNLTGITLGQIGVVSGSVLNQFTGDGTTTTYSISGYNGDDKGGYLVSVGGIDQPANYWSVTSTNGGQLTFVGAPKVGEIVSIRAILGNVYQTVYSYSTVTLGYGAKIFVVRPNTSMLQPGMAVTAYAANGNWMSGYISSVTSNSFMLSVNSVKGTTGASNSFWTIRLGFALNLSPSLPNAGDLLVFDGSQWSPGTAVSTSTNATQIQGVDIDNQPASEGDVLQYNNGMWISAPVPAADANATQIQGISVDETAPADAEVLKYVVGTGKWTPQPESTNATLLQGKAVSGAVPTNGQSLVWNGNTESWEPTSNILEWNANTNYNTGEYVKRDNRIYYANSISINQDPSASNSDSYWELVFGSPASQTPVNTAAPAGWIRVNIPGTALASYIPYYQ